MCCLRFEWMFKLGVFWGGTRDPVEHTGAKSSPCQSTQVLAWDSRLVVLLAALPREAPLRPDDDVGRHAKGIAGGVAHLDGADTSVRHLNAERASVIDVVIEQLSDPWGKSRLTLCRFLRK